MESLCSPSRGSTHPHCGGPTGEGEAARASSTDGNYSGLSWVLIGMQELLRAHPGCEPALPGPWNIGVWINSGSGWAPSGTVCSIPVGMEVWLPSLDPELPVLPMVARNSLWELSLLAGSSSQLSAAAAWDPEPGLCTRILPGAASGCRGSLSTAHGSMIMEKGWVGSILTEPDGLTEAGTGHFLSRSFVIGVTSVLPLPWALSTLECPGHWMFPTDVSQGKAIS